MTEVPLFEGERLDRLGFQSLKIIQHSAKFKFTIDAFLLAAAVDPRPGMHGLDLGAGGGVAPLLLAGRHDRVKVLGVEIQSQLVDMARRSVAVNNLTAWVDIIEADLRNLPSELGLNSFDFVVANPPFYPVGQGVIPANEALAAAKFEINGALPDFLQAAGRMVKGRGEVALVYPATRLGELLVELTRFHLTPKMLCLVQPRATANANLVLVRARPGVKPGLTVLPPVIIYDTTGEYTGRMRRIFDGAKLDADLRR
jgi:tRNA1Val (adenine37-N6)-methyltransferase